MKVLAKLNDKLASKISAILLSFFIFALLIIIATLYIGRQLEGGAAAINEAGAERMRAYRIAHLLSQAPLQPARRDALLAEAAGELQAFDAALQLLEEGDSERPLFLPRETHVRQEMSSLRTHWETGMRPLIVDALSATDEAERRRLVVEIDKAVRSFVPRINKLVLTIEKSNSHSTDLVWVYQNALVGFALAGTLFLSFLFNRLVIRPVSQLKEGMASMAAADFAARVPVETTDEIGELAAGFNRMADHLSDLYTTLEQRVADKTHDIEVKNRELAALYEIAAYLAEPADIESVCRGVIDRLRVLLGAEAGAVRLIDTKTHELELVAAANLSEIFLKDEARLPVGACLCGQAAACDEPVAEWPADCGVREGLLHNCLREGMPSMAAIPIRSKNQVFGIFNLFFGDKRRLAPNEIQLLETIGQHLGVAIDNLRLAVHAKENAVSEERNLLAQELHDSIAQSLAFLNLQAQMLQGSLRAGHVDVATEELARMREGIQESYDTVRELLVHFRIRVEHADLREAVASSLEKFEAQTGLATRLEASGVLPSLAASDILQLLHIVQEALSNVRKHAQASRVDVALSADESGLSISIVDNGRGFDPTRIAEAAGSHVGTTIMRERAHRIGARCELVSAAGCGTRINLILPRKS